MLIKATIAGGGVIPHIHKSLLEKNLPAANPTTSSNTWLAWNKTLPNPKSNL